MFSRLLLGGTFVVFALVIGVAFLTLPQKQAVTVSTPSTSQSASVTTANGYSMTDVVQHNSASSCWAAINGNVYDLTQWINQHPGGPDMIVALCGTDGSAAFNGQHGGQARPASELKNFLLGPLTQ